MPKIECTLCPRKCKLGHGQRGDCRVRTNVGGRLFSLAFGNPCAVHTDPIEKKPVFHMLPGTTAFSIATAGCNLHCLYCQNWEISQRPPEETSNTTLPPEEVVASALKAGCRSIAYTYSEPIVFYEYTLETSRLAHKKGLRNILVTAGYIEQEPLVELCKVTTAASVNLKGITEDFYKKMCNASLKPVQEAILTMKKNGVWVEIINLVIPTWNDSDADLRGLARWVKENCGKDTPLHLSRFWPMHKLQNLPPTPEATLNRAWELSRAEGLAHVYVGNIPQHPGNNTTCPACGKTIIQRYGYEIQENNLKKGKCGYCGVPIPGIWE
ncbi:MAG: AmmeMemoRadiSam system radical SAM enzyme [Candidatus Omnitrophica bacterium]|nr:AmmeMemoRadiSam system radical SAM enzyme [Candidatus Omnitrophota bacterium]